jgi:tetratricopeptide (TPR) repeat protein/DNA-binding CsgD family transcriptional regulator
MRILVTLLSLILSLNVFASKLDSLTTALQASSTDSSRVDILLQIVDETMYSKPNISLDYALQAYAISTEIKDNKRIFKSTNNIGILYNERGDYQNSIKYFKKSLKIVENDSVNLARTYGNLGNAYNYQSENEMALKYYLKSLKIFEKLKHKEGMSLAYGTIGNLYLGLKEYKHAFESYTSAENLFEELENYGGLATIYMNKGVIFRDNDKDYGQAISYFEKALKIYQQFAYQRGIAQCLGNIGESLTAKGDYEQANMKFLEALEIFRQSNNRNEEAIALVKIGDNANKLGQVKQAETYYREAFEIAKIDQSLKNLESASNSLYRTYKQQKSFSKALLHHELYAAYHDSLYNIEKEKRLQELLSKYDTEKKEKEIQRQQFELEKSKILISKKEASIRFYIILTMLFTLALILVAFAYIQKRRINILLKGQNALIEKQNAVLAKDKTILNKNLKDKTEVLEKIYTEKKSTELPAELLSLSKREMEVLSFLALGWTDKEISEKLFVSVSTTKTHLRRIYSKLLVNGRAGAVSIAHKYNIIGGIEDYSIKEESAAL